MKIKVKDLSKGVEKVPVRIPKAIDNISDEEILIKALDLKNEILDYHYNVEQEYKKVDDIYSDALVEYVADLIYDYCQDAEFDGYEEMAKRLIAKLEDDIIDEIYKRDDNARDWEEARNEGLKGDY